MASWKTPDLHKRLLDPEEARSFIEQFSWDAYGFPEGRPYCFESKGRKYYTKHETDDEAVSCALALILDFETDQAMQEKMRIQFEM